MGGLLRGQRVCWPPSQIILGGGGGGGGGNYFSGPKWPLAEDPIHLPLPER